MIAIKRLWTDLRARFGNMSWRRRLAAAALAGLLLLGGVWLAAASRRPAEFVPVLSETLDEHDLARATGVLNARGIACQSDGRRVLVPADEVQRARSILAAEGVPAGNPTAPLAQVVGEGDIWSSQSQSTRRWQAAKMVALGKLIRELPGIIAASVIFEPGEPHRLGSPGAPATAAVKVTLEPGAAMTDTLASAIVDQVAGCIPGMKRQDVRLVDNTGRSYRVAEGYRPSDDPVQQLRDAEAHYTARLRSALPYVKGLTVGVNVTCDDGRVRCTAASIAIPRSYLLHVYRAQHGGHTPDAAALEPVIAAELSRLRQAVAALIDADAPEAVTVSWYHDPPSAGEPPPEATGDVGNWAARNASLLALPAGVAGLGLLGVLLRRRARRAAGRAADGAEPRHDAGAGKDTGGDDEGAWVPFARLRGLGREQILSLVRQEHPQTVALVLAHLPSTKAAGVLAGLPEGDQVDLTRRIAAMERIDAEVVREVERVIDDRLAGRPEAPAAGGGLDAAADILHHAGYATEQAVLRGLADGRPSLAHSIGRRLFTFEDLGDLPAGWLQPAVMRLTADELALALRAAGDEVRRKVLTCLPSPTRREVRRQMDRLGPVRLRDVEAAQQRLVEAVRQVSAGQYVSGAAVQRELLA